MSQPFFISFLGRSGSTFLVGLLDSHPEICCEKEVFSISVTKHGPNRSPKFLSREAAHLELKRIYEKKCKASGFKFKYPLQYKFYPDVYEYFLERNDDIKVIYLYRKNLLKAAISKQNHTRLINLGKSSNLNHENYIKLDQLNLDIDQAIQYMNRRQSEDKKHEREIQVFSHRYTIQYEDLYKNTDSVIKKLYNFLEVDTNYKPLEQTVKITPDEIQYAISNYEELVTRFSGTPYEKYLEL